MRSGLVGNVAAVAMALLLIPLSGKSAPQFSNLYVVGDSLSDTGNLAAFASVIEPDYLPPPYFIDGRATNGQLAVEVMAAQLHANGVLRDAQTRPSRYLLHATGNTNYAVGSARAAGESPMDLGAQTTALIASQPALPSDALALVFVGGNDVLALLADGVGEEVDRRIRAAITAEVEAVRSLIYAGIRNLVVVEVADMGRIPKVPSGAAEAATLASGAYNRLLAEEIATLRAATDARIAIYPLFERFESAVAAQFPLQNRHIPCTRSRDCMDSEGKIAETVRDYLFLDEIHPTAQAHAFLGADMAEFVAEALPPLVGGTPEGGGDGKNGVGDGGDSGGDNGAGATAGGGGFDALCLLLLGIVLAHRAAAWRHQIRPG